MNSTLKEMTITAETSILEAMACIDKNARGIALVVQPDQRLIGTVTDGDLRRALLKGATLDAAVGPYMQRDYWAVGPTVSRNEVLDMMRARSIEQVPIVNAAGQLIGLHVLREMLGAIERPNWAVLLCGGEGLRLRPLTETIPKPMVTVAGRPLLERLVLHLVGYGFRRIFLAVNYKSEIIEQHFAEGREFGCRIEYLRERTPLHTGGALALLPEVPQAPLLVMNGDLLTQVDVAKMMAFHERGRYAATIGFRRYLQDFPFGCLEVEGDRLLRVDEKPVFERLVNAGVYVLAPWLIRRIPPRSYPITSLFEEALEEGVPIGVFEIEDEWMDIGYEEQLRAARRGGRDGILGGTASVGDGRRRVHR